MNNDLLDWFMKGDPSIIYQVKRDLLDLEESKLTQDRSKILKKGWGKAFMDLRNDKNFTWGNGIYSPKWISTTYTLLDLINMAPPQDKRIFQSSKLLLEKLWRIPEKKKERYLDLCICGMLLSICCYVELKDSKIDQIIDYILEKQFPDGGWNCRWEFDTNHSSLHTTINVLEGLKVYISKNYRYRLNEVIKSTKPAHEFILMHKLFRSDKTGKVIDKKMTMLSYPTRWRYDILWCLDYFQSVGQKYDDRMEDALEIVMSKKIKKNNTWPVQQKHPGLVHFDMEETGKSSTWNTLRSLRVLKKYKISIYSQLFP